MAAAPKGMIWRHLRLMLAERSVCAQTDQELLERFARQGDAAAFAVLVQRHGAMVLRVCQRVLRNAHDAEDAFQAAFLVLARKASGIRKQASVGSWLFGVAYRIALRARANARKRLARETEAAARPPPNPPPNEALDGLRELLDEELARLPEKYRSPVVLCYLESKTHVEAAQQLGWNRRTVKSRLERARNLLRTRLARRLLTSSSVWLSTALEANASTHLPPSLVDATSRAALLFAGDPAVHGGIVSSPAAALATGVLQTMTLTKKIVGLAAVLLLSVLGAGVGGYLVWKPSDRPVIGVPSERDAGALTPGNEAGDSPDPATGQPNSGPFCTGRLLPAVRRWLYPPVEGTVVQFADGVVPGATVDQGESLVLMHDVQLEIRMVQFEHEIAGLGDEIEALDRLQKAATDEVERARLAADKEQKRATRSRKQEALSALIDRTHAVVGRPGRFWLTSPLRGAILTWDFRENLTNRFVKPSEPLLWIGDKDGVWEIELKIPQKHIGPVLKAFDPDNPDAELDVDLLLTSQPTCTYKGKLVRHKIADAVSPKREQEPESEAVVLASVRIDGPALPPEKRIPRDLLLAGTEVHCRIRLGNQTPPGR